MRTSFLRRLDDRALPTVARIVRRAVRRKVVLGCLAAGLAAALVGAELAGDGWPQARQSAAPARVPEVGPVEGTPVADYLAATTRELAGLTGAGERQVYALVSLAGYGTPEQVARLGAGYTVVIAYFRIPLIGRQNEVRLPDDADVRRALEAQMQLAAAQAERAATAAEAQAARLTGTAPREQQLRAFYVVSARQSQVQAKEYRAACACVYSFVVRATPRELMTLMRRPGVRVIDPAPEISSADRARFLPLLPEQRTTVLPPTAASLPPLPAPSAGR